MSEDSATNDQPAQPLEVVAEERTGPGRPKGSKNKPKPEDLAKLASELGDESFRALVKKRRQEVYELASEKLVEVLKNDELKPSNLFILWGIAHDKVTAADAGPGTVINQQINISGVGRADLLKGLGVAKRVVELGSQPNTVNIEASPAKAKEAKQ